MKKTLFNILNISFIIAIIGFIMDGDEKEPNLLMRFNEFILITGIIFIIISTFYYTFKCVKRSISKT